MKQGRQGDSGTVALEMPWYYRNHRKSVNIAGAVPYFSALAGFCAAFALTAASSGSEARSVKKGHLAAVASPARQSRATAAVAAPSTASAAVAAAATKKKSVPKKVAQATLSAAAAGRTAGSSRSATSSRSASARWDRHLHAVPPAGTYLRSFRVRATAYTPINTPMEGGRWTATMRDGRSAHGVAVDPDLIPMGTRLWIPGYGHAVADDTGGAIQGHRIDVRMQNYQEMTDWGVRRIRIYVLQDSD